MKVTIVITRDGESAIFRKLILKPRDEQGLDKSNDEMKTFVENCYEEIEQESYI